jgi:hypothetical protein
MRREEVDATGAELVGTEGTGPKGVDKMSAHR